MSDVISPRLLKQTAVYWPPDEVGSDGRMTYLQPYTIKCRWEDEVTQFLAGNGTERLSRAVVMVDRDLELQGFLFLGKFADVTDLDVPEDNAGAYEIQRFDKTPNRAGKRFLRTVYL